MKDSFLRKLFEYRSWIKWTVYSLLLINFGYYSTEGFHWPAVIRMILGQAIFFSLLESFGWRIT